MMEPLRKDDNLTTADIAGHPPGEAAHGPRLVNQPSASAVTETEGPHPVNQPLTQGDRTETPEAHRAPLFHGNELREFRLRWERIQTSFVDEPREAVHQADSLVAATIKQLAEQFAQERSTLERQWGQGDNVSTEDLRQALRRYRSFFDRLLAA